MAEENKAVDNDDFAGYVRELNHCVENGDTEGADRILDQIAKLRETSLFQELGKLTREFHETLNTFRLDSRLASFAEEEFPNARERLRHVIEMTGKSADRSLTAAEQSMPLCDDIEVQAADLKSQWERFVARDLSADEFRELSGRIAQFFDSVGNDAGALRSNLTEVMMAQDFQDLTGQIIERVITLVDDMENSLVDLIRISGANLREQPAAEKKEEDILKGTGPVVPGVDDAADNIVSGQDDVDDLLSSLGF